MELENAKTISSFVCYEFDRGKQEHKVASGKFLAFGRIAYFVEHVSVDNERKDTFAFIEWFKDAEFDSSAGLWFTNLGSSDTKNEYVKFLPTKDLPPPLVTGVDKDNNRIWFLNSGESPI